MFQQYTINSAQVISFEQLYAASIDLLYVPQQKKQGIIITEANLLSSYGKISALSIGKDEEEATDYLAQFQDRIIDAPST